MFMLNAGQRQRTGNWIARVCRARGLFGLSFWLMLLVASGAEPAMPNAHPLAWDALEKAVDVKKNVGAVEVEFAVTNRSGQPVEILQLRPSCGCTTAEMPSSPWVLAPAAKGSFRAIVDVRGKVGRFSKTVFVNSTAGTQVLTMVLNLPEPDEADRQRNQQLAATNRQAVFRGECAKCHLDPIATAKTGADLFQAACTVCHMASPRASVVSNLLEPTTPRDAAYWRKWISEGKEASLMPAFAREHGGPLTADQITALVDFALVNLPQAPRKD